MYIHNMNKNLKSILGITFRHFQIYLVNAMVDIRACVLQFWNCHWQEGQCDCGGCHS